MKTLILLALSLISSGLSADSLMRSFTSVPVTATGNVASGATDSGNPVKVGGKYNSTPISLTNGQRGDLQVNSRGELYVAQGALVTYSLSITAATTNATLVYAGNAQIISIVANNGGTAGVYLRIYNKATTPVPGTDRPRNSFLLASNGGQLTATGLHIDMSNGIGFATTQNQANMDATNIGADSAQITIVYRVN
jgi:hypothetical protein